MDALENYSWPGNVRELENLVENLVITTKGDTIKRNNLPQKFQEVLSYSNLYADGNNEISMPLKDIVNQAERTAIERAVQQFGSVRRAAAALQVNPSTITRKLQSYKIEPEY